MPDPTSPPDAAAASRLQGLLRALARATVGLAVVAFTLLLAAWLALHWAILPHIEHWRPSIEREAGKALGVIVRIGSIEVRSAGWVPTVELREVQLLDAEQRPALQLGRVVASVSARSLAASLSSLELRLSQLVIDGARLEVRRDASGRVFVAGIDVRGGERDDDGAADWILRQGEIAVRRATLRWTDEQRGAPPLELDAVDLVLRNTLRRHALRLDATPPAEWGERFTLRGEFRQPLLARPADWHRWTGQVYADAPRADASQVRTYVDLPFELDRGVGALRAWFDVREGVVGEVTLDAALRSAELRLGAGLEPLVALELEGRLTATRRADGGAGIALRGLGFVTGEGVRWPPGDLDLSWSRAADGSVAGGEFSAQRLDLALVADTAARLPLGATLRQVLAELQPKGIANGLRAAWKGPLAALASYRFSGRFEALSVAARLPADGHRLGRPGVTGVDIDLDASEQGGSARIALRDGTIDLPGVFEDPLVALDDLRADLVWRIQPVAGGAAALQVQVRSAQFANADAAGELQATWSTSPGAARLPGRLELDGKLTRGNATRAARYLPLALPEGVRRYVHDAVRGGAIKSASYRVSGDLTDFPRFASGAPGDMRIALEVEDGTFAYVPEAAPAAPAEPAPATPWQPMTQVAGELVFERSSFEFRDGRARIHGVELTGLRGGIPNLTDKPLLTLQTQAQGPLADMLRFAVGTPAGDGVRATLRAATASGDAGLQLALRMPLGDLGATSISGSLALSGNDLRLRTDLPALAAARGRIAFTDHGFALADAKARVLGGEVAIDGGTQPDGSLRLTLAGRASAEVLRQTPELGALARSASALSGQAGYRLALGIDARSGLLDVDLTSDLAGIAIDLPAPLAKRAEAAWPLRVHLERAGTAASAAQQDRLQVDLGDVLHAWFLRDVSGDTARVLRGGIGVFEPAPTPAGGVAAAATLAALDVEAWDAKLTRLLGGGAGEGMAADGGSGYLPDQVALRAKEVAVLGQRLTQVTAGLSRADAQWRANVNADQLSGYLEFSPAAAGGARPGRVHARLARLALERSAADDVTRLLDQQPASVPALDVVVEDLQLRGRALGRLEMNAVNRGAPNRQWELLRLSLTLPEARFGATGRWVLAAGAGAGSGGARMRQAEYKFELDIADSGALLRRFGNPDAIRGGKGRVAGTVNWLGSPLQPDFDSMTGQFDIAIEKGVFLHAQTGGAARLLGVLSLQGLLRRLTFDFRDLSEDGFAFDSVAGEVAIARGVASTNNLVMRGAHAAVLLEGSADAKRETQDLRVFVVPDLNLGAASLAYAVINPVIGLSTFAAQLFLREPLAQAYTREFRVVGSWADPQVEPVERQPGQAVPRIAAPAASGAAPPSSADEVAR